MAFYALIYRSQATVPVTAAVLRDILDSARRHNRAHRVTGLLVYRDGAFLQLLEGARPAVLKLFETIGRDPRHADVVVVAEIENIRRFLPAWDMGFSAAKGIDPEVYLREDFISEEIARQLCATFPPAFSQELLAFLSD